MKFITNDRRECGDPIVLPQRLEIATSLCSSQRLGRNEADVVRSARLLEVKMPTVDVEQPINKVMLKILSNSSYDVDNIEN